TLFADVIINEIHLAPEEKTLLEEFVELHNTGDEEVDLSGWYFSNGIDFVFPQGTTIDAGGYLVIVQDTTAFGQRFGNGLPIVGPFEGRLSNQGELLLLRSADGAKVDRVEYGVGFPWPIAGGDIGQSIELLNPSLDNDLGGSWRIADPGASDTNQLLRGGQTWRYLKGEAEASSPKGDWRELGFDDSDWDSGRAPIGYGEGIVATELNDMRDNYSSVFLRKTIEIADASQIGRLTLEATYDDGFNAWINGVHVAGGNMSSENPDYDDTANSALEETDFLPFEVSNPRGALRNGTNVIAVQMHNASLGGSSDAWVDVRLTTASAGAGPTPAAQNATFTTNLPPILRQARHEPHQPVSNVGVLLSIKATDDTGIDSVTAEYQVVDPGSYIELGDAAYDQGWVSVELNDAGADGDAFPGDDRYSAILPASIQEHRRLVRYRFIVTDSNGLTVRAPLSDDTQPNFAYFVYDGAPTFSGAIQPGSSNAARRAIVEHSVETMNSLPIYHLITKRSSAEDCTWNSRYGGSDYRWTGTLVYDGDVYDHVNFRARGGVWRYAMGKNMWKFDFQRGHSFSARDNYGKRYDTAWDKLNFSAIIQQGNFLHRGEQGLFESSGFKMFGMMGVEAPNTHYVQFRVIDEASENGGNQYGGDFWGLYLVVEQMDGRFLDEHDLPDGNLYKMESGTGTLNNQGPYDVTNRSDLNTFLSTYNGNPSDTWWRQNLDLDRYYGYRSVVEGIHHYDIAGGKNYFYYRNPETNLWSVLPWDLDLTWANNMFGSGNEPFKSRVLNRSNFSRDYKNRMREFRDLLYNSVEMGKMLNEFAAVADDGSGTSLIDADRRKWDYNPVMVSGLVNGSKA
ncbi:MAG: CotH kinase family protein, partial [Planctomycetota bacterium]